MCIKDTFQLLYKNIVPNQSTRRVRLHSLESKESFTKALPLKQLSQKTFGTF